MENLEPRLYLAAYYVDSPIDAKDATSLRGAIYAALQTPEDDVVRIAQGLTLELTLGEITLDVPSGGAIRIVGGEDAVVDVGNAGRVFSVAAGVEAEFENLTLVGGRAESGGAILNAGTLTLRGVAVSDCAASSYGGAVCNEGTLNVVDTTFSDVTSTSENGGAIANFGTAALLNATVTRASAYAKGGAIWNSVGAEMRVESSTVIGNESQTYCGAGVCNEGSLILSYSEVAQNTARSSFGGGIYSSGELCVVNSLIAANRALGASSYGGGLYVAYGTAQVVNSTVAGNFASWQAGGVRAERGEFTLYNTIVAQNKAASQNDLYASVDIHGAYNWIGSDPSFVVEPRFAPDGTVANYGALNFRLSAGSACVDAGNDANAVDENGSPLVRDLNGPGYPRVRGTRVDVGAYEYFESSAPCYASPAVAYVGLSGSVSVVVEWTIADPAPEYVVEYRAKGSDGWTAVTAAGGTSVLIAKPAFNAGDAFEIRVKASASSVKKESEWSETVEYLLSDNRPSFCVQKDDFEFGDGHAVVYEIVAYDPCAFWKIDWRDGSVSTFIGLADVRAFAHWYGRAGTYAPVLYVDGWERGLTLDVFTVYGRAAASLDSEDNEQDGAAPFVTGSVKETAPVLSTGAFVTEFASRPMPLRTDSIPVNAEASDFCLQPSAFWKTVEYSSNIDLVDALFAQRDFFIWESEDLSGDEFEKTDLDALFAVWEETAFSALFEQGF